MSKVSVIIPVYSVEGYIERCARSLFEQTLDSIEFLFIDDCTPDRSIDILNRIIAEYPQRKDQIIIHKMEKNSGQAAVRKWGMLNATGDYIIHCDSDDWVDSTMYEKMYTNAIKNDADVVICGYYISDYNGLHKQCSSVKCSDKSSIIADLLKFDDWCVWNKLVKRSIFNRRDYIFPKENMGEDVLMTIQNLYFAQKISYVEEPLYNYFLNNSSITHQISPQKLLDTFSQCMNNIDMVCSFVENNGDSKMIETLDALKFVKKNMLLNSNNELLIRRWESTYQMSFYNILFNKYIPYKDMIWAWGKLIKYKSINFYYEKSNCYRRKSS